MGPPLCWAFNLFSFLFNQKSPEYYHIHFTQYKSNIKRGWITHPRLYIQDSDSGIPPLSPALGHPLSHIIPPRSDQESALPPACLRKCLFCILPAPKKEQFAHLMYTCFPFLTRVKKKKKKRGQDSPNFSLSSSLQRVLLSAQWGSSQLWKQIWKHVEWVPSS